MQYLGVFRDPPLTPGLFLPRFNCTLFLASPLLKAGVVFAKGYRVVRLWGVDEEGSFPTLERSPQMSTLKRTLPRTFGLADPHFTECRGVVLSSKHTGEQVRERGHGFLSWLFGV